MTFYFRQGSLWHRGGGSSDSKILTILFFPRLSPLSDTKMLLLYPTVPDLM